MSKNICCGKFSKERYEICEENCNKAEQLKCKEKEDKIEEQRLNNLDIKPSVILTKFGCDKCG